MRARDAGLLQSFDKASELDPYDDAMMQLRVIRPADRTDQVICILSHLNATANLVVHPGPLAIQGAVSSSAV